MPKTSVDMIRLCAHASLHRLRTDYHDVLLCHEGDIEDPSVYLDGFRALQEEGRLRCYGISTNSVEALRRFNHDGGCKVVQVDWSIIQRRCEAPSCYPTAGPRRSRSWCGGRWPRACCRGATPRRASSPTTSAPGTTRAKGGREQYLEQLRQVDLLRERVEPQDMISTALGYVISHPVNPVAIPGAKSPEQAAMNAAAGDDELSEGRARAAAGLR